MRVRRLSSLLLLAACAHPYPPPLATAPLDPHQRRAAEVAACTSGTLPAWLDEAALNAAIDADTRDARASASNEAFHGGTYVSQPPPLVKPGPRARGIEDERRSFELACAASKRRTP